MSTAFKTTAVMEAVDRHRWLRMQGDRVAGLVETKYEEGEREHQSDLGLVPTTMLLSHLEEELVDGMCYLAEMRRRLEGEVNLSESQPVDERLKQLALQVQGVMMLVDDVLVTQNLGREAQVILHEVYHKLNKIQLPITHNHHEATSARR